MNNDHDDAADLALGERMRHAADTITVDTDRITINAANSGKRRTNLRRTGITGLSVAAAAVFAVALTQGLNGAGQAVEPATAPSTFAPDPAPTTPTPEPVPSTEPDAAEARTFALMPEGLGAALADTVREAAPDATVSAPVNWSEGTFTKRPDSVGVDLLSDPFQGAAVVVDDGLGSSRVDLLVADNEGLGLIGPNPTCVGAELSPSHSCSTGPDGSIIVTLTDWAEQRSDGALVSNNVTVMTADGWLISATSYNSATEKDSPITRDSPAFDEDQLRDLALDDRWLTGA